MNTVEGHWLKCLIHSLGSSNLLTVQRWNKGFAVYIKFSQSVNLLRPSSSYMLPQFMKF